MFFTADVRHLFAQVAAAGVDYDIHSALTVAVQLYEMIASAEGACGLVQSFDIIQLAEAAQFLDQFFRLMVSFHVRQQLDQTFLAPYVPA